MGVEQACTFAMLLKLVGLYTRLGVLLPLVLLALLSLVGRSVATKRGVNGSYWTILVEM